MSRSCRCRRNEAAEGAADSGLEPCPTPAHAVVAAGAASRRPEEAAEEAGRITKELAGIAGRADFPVEFAEVASVNDVKQLAGSPQVKAADVVIVYGAGGAVNGCQNFGKDVIIFQRHRSGPVYLQYEIVSPRFLRQHTDDAGAGEHHLRRRGHRQPGRA